MSSAKILSFIVKNLTTKETDRRNAREGHLLGNSRNRFFISLLFLCSYIILCNACANNQTQFQNLAPANTIIFFESRDLGAMLSLAIDNKKFNEAGGEADFSVVRGMRLAVFVTGLTSDEKAIGDNRAVLNLTPKFFSAIDTNAWSWQVSPLIETNLDSFVRRTYGEKATRQISSVDGLDWYRWQSEDGREVWAVADGEIVFFGNDHDGIAKALGDWKNGGKRNETLEKELSGIDDSVAYSIVSGEGIIKISDVIGVTTAVEKTEDGATRGVISELVPELMRNLVQGATWRMVASKAGVRDEIRLKLKPNDAEILADQLRLAKNSFAGFSEFIPRRFASVTRYDLANPRVGFESIVLTAANNVAPANGRLISQFSNSTLLSYGIEDAGKFFGAVQPAIITGVLDAGGDNSFAIVKVKDQELLIESIAQDLKFDPNTNSFRSEEGNLAAFIGEFFLIGSQKAISQIMADRELDKTSPLGAPYDERKTTEFESFIKASAPVTTLQYDDETAFALAKLFAAKAPKEVMTYEIRETQFNKSGVLRVYESEFGMIGSFVKQFE